MWKEILEKLVELLKHMINVLMLSCCRDNMCISECCVKNEEIKISDNNIKECQKEKKS